MSNFSSFVKPFCVTASLAVGFLAVAQSGPPQFTARELFYAGDPETAKTIVKAPPKSTPKRPVTTQVASAPKVPPATPQSKPTIPDKPHTESASAKAPDGQTPILLASADGQAMAPMPSNGPALGMRITILKGTDEVEVPKDTVFHAGDKIRFAVQCNSPGYLYIISRGSSGTWKPIFPSKEIADGDNHVEGFRPYKMPPKSRMVFDEQTGAEKLFIVFSREPEPEFENMIYSLPGSKATPEPTKPASTPESPVKKPKDMVMMAQVNIKDTNVNQLRQTYSRDLIIETVDDKTPNDRTGDKKEKAIYVINPTGSPESRVVADLELTHQ